MSIERENILHDSQILKNEDENVNKIFIDKIKKG